MSPTKFRKKPVVVEAVRFDGTNHTELCDFFGAADHEHFDNGGYSFDPTTGLCEDGDPADGTGSIEVVTLEGRMKANEGDWVIRGVNGEFYPCKPDIFAATYEVAVPTIDR